jgi:hypothetical protein
MSNQQETIAAYQAALDQMPAQQTDTSAAQVMSTLLARDRLARALAQSQPTAGDLSRVAALDQRLRDSAGQIESIAGRDTLAAWRDALQPPTAAWWWPRPPSPTPSGRSLPPSSSPSLSA